MGEVISSGSLWLVGWLVVDSMDKQWVGDNATDWTTKTRRVSGQYFFQSSQQQQEERSAKRLLSVTGNTSCYCKLDQGVQREWGKRIQDSNALLCIILPYQQSSPETTPSTKSE